MLTFISGILAYKCKKMGSNNDFLLGNFQNFQVLVEIMFISDINTFRVGAQPIATFNIEHCIELPISYVSIESILNVVCFRNELKH